jgi:hypothetical protein
MDLHFTSAPADDEFGVKKISHFPYNLREWRRLNINSIVKGVVKGNQERS